MDRIFTLLKIAGPLFGLAILMGCQGTSPVAPPSTLPGSDMVVARYAHLYIMRNEDSLHLVPLIDTTSTVVPGWVLCPKLSPDRKLIAFYARKSPTDLRMMLCVVRIDGKDLRTVSVVTLPGQLLQWGFNWSPDGQMLAFGSPKDATNMINNIYIVRADGTGERQITNDNCLNIRPKWSYDGSAIAFFRAHPDGQQGFALYDLTTSKMIEATTQTASYFWSPNSNTIAFTAHSESSSVKLGKDLELTKFDGSTLTKPVILHSGAYSGTNMGIWGGWNPSGTDILIATSNDTGLSVQNAQVLLVDAKTGNSKPITYVHDPSRATWSKDGNRIFFTTFGPNPYPWGDFDLYVMNSDGSGRRLLVRDIEDPDW